ncbi:MAG: peptide chain release factor N(5)-glutamine methyltransferase [Alteraurantiacibacter sp.]
MAEALRTAAQHLSSTSDTARLDAELLMAHTFGVSRSDLLLRHMRDPAPANFEALVERRAKHEPVAYMTGHQEFFGLPFKVAPGVLIPRADSESVVEAALEAVPDAVKILDLGTGPGTLLLALLSQLPEARGTGMDASDTALHLACTNAGLLGCANRATFTHINWTQPGWADALGQFDLVIANPPYVESDADLAPDVRDYEPAEALFAGEDGLADYRIIIPALPKLLTADGVAVLEIGWKQADAVTEIAEDQGFAAETRQDLGERDRAIILRQRAWQRPIA